MKQLKALLLSTLVTLAACNGSWANEEEDMMILASALTKVATALESTVRYKNPPEGAVDQELIEFATKHDPGMLTPFKKYLLRAKGDNRHGVVLLCTIDGKKRLIEDAGCSAKVDAHHWRTKPAQTCDFALDITEICPN